MKTFAAFLILFTTQVNSSLAQDNEKSWFDFWVGSWEVSWEETDGKIGTGTNMIAKVLDNTVIQENFRVLEGTSKGYLGTSLSVYNPSNKIWHQGYADNQGGFFSFIGERDNDRRIFKTDVVVSGEKRIIQRMIFYNIQDNSLTWDWESSQDDGKTWQLNWRISYKRKVI